MKKPRSYAVVVAAGCVSLAYAVRLSAPSRGAVDLAVILGFGGMATWGAWGLAHRLWAAGREAALGHMGRVATLWLVGLMNTCWARPGEAGTWRAWVGWALLAAAVADSVALVVREARIAELRDTGD